MLKNKLLNQRRLIFLLAGFCLLITSLVLLRWLVIVPKDIASIDIGNTKPQVAQPLDEVLQANLSQLSRKNELAKQFAKPQKLLAVTPLWIDECEVTQRDFGRFRQWTAVKDTDLRTHPQQPADQVLKSNTAGHKLLGRLNMPVGGVSLFEAYAYCDAAGGRLPTSGEFQAIAGNKLAQLYPWGDRLGKEQLQSGWPFRDPALNVQACGTSANLANQQGIQDLGNNLLEWALDNQNDAYLMGGNALQRPANLYALNLITRSAPLDYRSQYSGFRCVYQRPQGIGNVAHTLPWGTEVNLIAIDKGVYPVGVPPQALIPQMLTLLEPEQFQQLEQLPLSFEAFSGRISKHEIQVKQYAKFLLDPLVALGFFNHPRQPAHIQHRPHNWQQQQQHPNRPITNVSWWSAYAFADWLGGRLMSNREWKAIAGSQQSLYPWGNDYEVGRSLDRHHPGNQWQPRDAQLSDDASAEGVIGLAGNVAEWTSSVIHYGNEFHVLVKGGSFLLPFQANQVAQTASVSPNYVNKDLGFRVIFVDNKP